MADDTAPLTRDQRHQARLIFEGQAPNGQTPCLHCGGIHLRACRRVKSLEWHLDGSVLKAEYWPDGKWNETNITWPEEAYEDEEPADDAASGDSREP